MVWLVLLPDISQKILNCPFILYSFLNGTQIPFEFHLSFQNLQEDLSPHLKRVFICPQSFLKANKVPIPFFKSCERIHQPIGKKAWQIRKRIKPTGLRNQATDAIAGFENSN